MRAPHFSPQLYQGALITTHLAGFACLAARRASRSGVLYRKQRATPRAGKQTRPAVARGGSPGAIEWVNINAPWYYLTAVDYFRVSRKNCACDAKNAKANYLRMGYDLEFGFLYGEGTLRPEHQKDESRALWLPIDFGRRRGAHTFR